MFYTGFLKTKTLGIHLGILSLGLGACGGGGGAAGNFTGLQDLPSSSEMVSTSNSTSSLVRAAVTGTPPTLAEMAELGDENEAELFEIFWQDMVANILNHDEENLTGQQCTDYSNQFWGNSTQSENVGGMGACQMSQMVGQTFSEVLQSGTSLCYMKNLPTLESGVSISGNLSDPTTIFNQQANDIVVKVSIKGSAPGDEEEEEVDPDAVNQYVFIKVKGTGTVGSNTYAVNLWFCRPNDEEVFVLDGAEDISVNKSTGAYTSTSVNSDDRGNNNFSLSANIKEVDGRFVFDPDSERRVNIAHTQTQDDDTFTFKSQILIDSDNRIYSKMWDIREGDQDEDWRRYAISGFSGDSVRNLRFLQAAVKEAANDFNGGGFNTSVEYRSNGYYAAPDSELKDLVDAFDFDEDSFFSSEPEVDTSSLSDYNCSPDVDYEVTMDFGDSAVEDVAAVCDGQRLDNFNFCWGESIQQAQQTLFGDACGP